MTVVLITGVTGQDGSCLTAFLLQKTILGFKHRALDRIEHFSVHSRGRY